MTPGASLSAGKRMEQASHARLQQMLQGGSTMTHSRRAGTHVLDEAERSLHDALCVLSQTVVDRRVLLGGGWPEIAMAHAVHTQVAPAA